MDKSDSHDPEADSQEREEVPEPPCRGPSLVLIYSLIALAILVATVIAAFIVLPFYLRR
jgi:hypothetical protein